MGKDQVSDLLKTKLGWVSLKNDDVKIGPKYLNSFNHPVAFKYYEHIIDASNLKIKDIIRTIFTHTNGMRLFSDRFALYGVRLPPDGLRELDFFNIALDFSYYNEFEYPLNAPDDGILVGTSLSENGRDEIRLHDVITNECEIVSGFFDENAEVVEMFRDVDDWISTKVAQARSNFLSS